MLYSVHAHLIIVDIYAAYKHKYICGTLPLACYRKSSGSVVFCQTFFEKQTAAEKEGQTGRGRTFLLCHYIHTYGYARLFI